MKMLILTNGDGRVFVIPQIDAPAHWRVSAVDADPDTVKAMDDPDMQAYFASVALSIDIADAWDVVITACLRYIEASR